MDDKLAALQAKKIGLFLRKIREENAHTQEECANWLNIELNTYQSIELGNQSPSLPQLESLAYFLKTSFDTLLKGPESLTNSEYSFTREVNDQIVTLRNRVISVMLKQQRNQKSLTIEQLAEATQIQAEVLINYESGTVPIPLTELEKIVDSLGVKLEELFASTGPFTHLTGSEQIREPVLVTSSEMPSSPTTSDGLDLPEDIKQFVLKPINRPYLELAMRLSKLEAEKLRDIATSLLEITY
jgi:transcriptional regulator with XRE-family HTH domain